MGIVKEVGRRILKVSVMMGGKQKTLQVKFNHVKPLTHGTETQDVKTGSGAAN
jgi:ribosomal protein L21E